MPLVKRKAKCPRCQTVLSVKHELHGRNIKCPGCGARFVLDLSVVESNPSLFRDDADQPETTEAHGETPDSNQKSRSKSKDQKGVPVSNAVVGPVQDGSDQVGRQNGVRDFGRYRLIKKLGRGSFGEVWEAEDVHLQRRVALKLPTFPPSDAKKAKRFMTEAQSAAQLGHPNIVAVYDAATVESQHYLAIEYIAGQPLDKFAKEQKIDQRHAARLVAALARALSYAHGEGIIHRDIKPANIVLEADGTPKIVDFGLAKRLGVESNQTVDGTVLGTPAYMSPEQARGATNEIGPHSDQYSLGVVLYWLLTGQAPFIGPTIAVISQVINSDPTPPRKVAASIDPKLEAICLKAMAKVPASRYRNCLEFAKDLDRFFNGEDVIAKPEGLPARVLRSAKRYPRQFALGIGFAILSTIALVTTVTGMARAYSLAAVASKAEKKSEDRLSEQNDLRKKSEAQLALADAARTRSVEALRTTEEKKKEIEQVNQDLEASIAANVSKNAELKAKLAALDQSKSVTTQSEEVIREASAKSSQIKLKESADLIKQGNWDSAAKRLGSVPEKDRKWQWHLLNGFAHSNIKLFPSKTMLLELPSSQGAVASYDHDDDVINLRMGNVHKVIDARSFGELARDQKPLLVGGTQSREFVRSSNYSVWFPEGLETDFSLDHLIEDPRDHKVFAWGHSSAEPSGAKVVGTLLAFENNAWKRVWTTQNLPYRQDPVFEAMNDKEKERVGGFARLLFDRVDRNVLFATDKIVVTREIAPNATQSAAETVYELNGRLIQPDDLLLKERLMTHNLKKGHSEYLKQPIEASVQKRDSEFKIVFTLKELEFRFELELIGLDRKRLDDEYFEVFLGSDFGLIVVYGNVLARYELK